MFSAAPASAQTATVGPFTERPGQVLSRNLRTLAANPKSVTALMGAGRAALDLGDAQAALTFFARAEEQTPRDGRIKMWIASALVQLQQPHAALKFFRDATELGVPAADVARDLGLAHDLAGNPREAQRAYRSALQQGRDPEVTRRLALSLAISGEREPALRLLEEQLLVRDRAAERTRALVLALTGDTAGATRAVEASMPGQAGAMTPFLARLPSLAPAERALAVHLGIFPSDGRTPPPSSYAVNNFASAVTDAGRPDPGREPLGRRSPPADPVAAGSRPRSASGTATASATPPPGVAPPARTGNAAAAVRSRTAEQLAELNPRRTTSRPSASPGFGGNPAWSWSRGLSPSPARRQPEAAAATKEAAPRQAEVRAPSTTTAAAAPSTSTSQPQPQPPAEVRVAEASPAPLQPEPQRPAEAVPQSQPQPEAPAQLQPQPEPQPQPAEVSIAALEPSAPPPQAEAAPSGNRLADLSAAIAGIDEPKPAATRRATPAPAKKAAPADPSRAWVQIAVGAAKAALPREYTRLKAKAPKLLGTRTAWTAPLNATNRLLVGPFASTKEAQAFVNQLKAEDLSGFAWTSPAGQKVEKLPAR